MPNSTPYSKFVAKFKALAMSELASRRAFAPDLAMVPRALRDALLDRAKPEFSIVFAVEG